MRLSNPHHRYSAKKQSSFDGSYCVSAQKNAPNIITRAHGRYAGQLKTFPRHLLSDAMCLVENLHQRLKTRWFSSGCLSDTEGLNPQVREDGPSAIVAALHCLGGKGGTLLSHASSNLRQQFGVPSDDKTWLVMPVPEDCTFASMYLGQESVFFLAHYAEEV